MVIANSIFRKKDEHLISYKSGGHATQVDYWLVRKRNRTSSLDSKEVLDRDAHSTYVISTSVSDEEENCRKEVRIQGKDHAGET